MKKQTPAQKVLERAFIEFSNDGYPGEPADAVFEVFVADLLLRQKGLDDEEILSGIVDGSRDGGIDAFYTFLNGALVQSDHPALESEEAATKLVGASPTLEVLVLQAKNKTSWEESAIDRLYSSLPLLLDPLKTEAALRSHFRDEVVAQAQIYKLLSEHLAMKFPRFTFRVVYATRAPENAITSYIKTKAEQVQHAVSSFLTPKSNIFCELVGSDCLYDLAGRTYSAPAELRFRSPMLREDGAFLGIASLEDYLSFVRDDNDVLRSEMFESNVRDYEGANQVNRSIQNTLAEPSGAEFWWQNNGVTVLGRQVNAPNQILTIEQPLIVNGLQTTHVLHQAERDGRIDSSRIVEGILVRVIESDDDEVRDEIIAGTNRQTKVGGSALFASDQLQINIERFFLANDWYYERRKNRYKNMKKPASRRISIVTLAQAIMTLNLGQPDEARGRPESVLQKNYDSIFNDSISMDAYLKAAKILSAVSKFLRTAEAKKVTDDYSNVRFYLAVAAFMAYLGVHPFQPAGFRDSHNQLPDSFPSDFLMTLLLRVDELFEEYAEAHLGLRRDLIAKSSDFRSWFLGRFNPAN